MNHPPGTAPVKQEYLLTLKRAEPLPDDDAAEGKTAHTGRDARDSRDSQNGGPSRRKMTKEEKKAQRGANKGRRFAKVKDEFDLCFSIGNGKICEHGSKCKFSHDIPAYLDAKPKDLPALQSITFSSEPPFVSVPESSAEEPLAPSLDPQTVCTIFNDSGECRFGYKCRFLGQHIHKDESGHLQLIVDEEKNQKSAVAHTELNYVGNAVQKLLKGRKYPTPIADVYVKEVQERGNDEQKPKNAAATPREATVVDEPEQANGVAVDGDATMEDAPGVSNNVDAIVEKRTGDPSSTSQVDSPDAAVRFSEKKRLHWTGKTYLAPLTTVGNLPFRRLCVKYGADITCGEMGLALSFLQGSREEWSLVRRHPSESIFGVQVAGNKPATLVPTAEVLAKECGSGIDFVDVNCGCPIDLVFKQGSGSALLDAPGKLGKILIGMNKALGEIPVTVKIRTGVKDGKNNAHKLMPRAATEWGASCITLHGRTRQQRYTRLADWDYIRECVDAVRAKEADDDLPPVPIFGGGDVFSSQDYWEKMEKSKVDGIMIGRGALIKPWIFTEIKERREWDISSRERLDLVRTYAEYGLSHFGTDTAGVNTTRRYLCEALSFQYRYIPIGLLETLPGRINDRAPAFRGRDDLEMLLSSPDSNDWVKISEMFLGPAPENWSFTPKHKSNAYGSEEGQG